MSVDNELGTVALFGAAGAIGHALRAELDAKGTTYRAVGRDVDRIRAAFPKAEAVSADFFGGEGVDAAAQGVTTIFYLAGAPYTEFEKHPVMVRNALDAAEKAGVKRFVHVAPVYSYGPALQNPVPESQPHQPNSKKGRFRLEQEQAVLGRHGNGIATMVVHLPDFYGPYAELSYANSFMREAVDGKTASFVGPMNATREFIFVPDASDPLLRVAALDDCYGRCWNLGGQAVNAQAFVDATFGVLHTAPKVRSISKVMLKVVGAFNPLMREVAEMYYLFDSGFVLDDSALSRRLGGYEKTPFPEGIARTVEWMKKSS